MVSVGLVGERRFRNKGDGRVPSYTAWTIRCNFFPNIFFHRAVKNVFGHSLSFRRRRTVALDAALLKTFVRGISGEDGDPAFTWMNYEKGPVIDALFLSGSNGTTKKGDSLRYRPPRTGTLMPDSILTIPTGFHRSKEFRDDRIARCIADHRIDVAGRTKGRPVLVIAETFGDR